MSGIQRRPLRGPRGARRRLLGVPLLAGLAVLAMLVPLAVSHDPTAGAAVDRDVPGPLLFSRGFADPTVVESRVGLVGAATALDLTIGRAPADTGPWSVAPTPALTRRPGWATSVDIWAPDIQRAPGGWLMYFAAGIAGADESSRCIGVAHAKAAYGPYTPVGNAPLVCPVVPGVPRAGDRPANQVRGERVPVRGVIDPSSFVADHGQRYLVYRTQGQPSSIRLVKLSQRGRRIQQGQTSALLLSSSGIEENPVITRHGDKWVLFTSVGWFGHCGYRTAWRRSPDFRDWSRARPRPILSTADGLCGPGGADVLQRRDGTTQLYFHAWTCFRGPYPCPPDWNKDHPQQRHGLRALYGATLRWTAAGRPVVASWVGAPLPPPTPTPTPTPTDTDSHRVADRHPHHDPDQHGDGHGERHGDRLPLRPVTGSRRTAWATAAAADVVAVLVFATIGRAGHDEPVTVAGVWHVAWPFLLAAGVGLASAALSRDDPRSVRVGVRVWLVTVVLGMVLRRLAGAGTAAAFVVVATLVLGVFLVGWRLVARMRRRTSLLSR